ncbi:hypothetical protein [Flavobacterium sp. 3HN19-14]|uniref:hypothetical protein n=1 Tax=Flavobacterium sp. 3HN19-14 TaxID=3448133 RepID=UPI003EDEA947
MSNLTFNRINTVLSEEDLATINTHIEALLEKLPAIGMTPAERKSFRGMNVHNKAYAKDCINMLKMNGAETMPSYINIENLIADYELFEQLDKIKSRLKTALSYVETAQRITGKEAYDMTRAVHDLYGIAADSGVAGAKTSYDKLSERYEKQTGRKKGAKLP